MQIAAAVKMMHPAVRKIIIHGAVKEKTRADI